MTVGSLYGSSSSSSSSHEAEKIVTGYTNSVLLDLLESIRSNWIRYELIGTMWNLVE